MIADKGYGSDALVDTLKERGITPVIASKVNRKEPRKNGHRPLSRAQPRGALRQQVEALPRHCHPLRQARNTFLAGVLLVCVLIWLN
ncbi:MAG: transposase [Hyphomicrobiaceae bacterium]|nr:transposase [Hyphomicrobiaceae bacterium]